VAEDSECKRISVEVSMQNPIILAQAIEFKDLNTDEKR
jgi:hypothetical protein